MKWLWLVLLVACNSRDVEVRLRLADVASLHAEDVQFEPRGHVRSMRIDERGWLQLITDGSKLRVRMPGHCDVRIEREEVTVKKLFTYPDTLAQVGYDSPFALHVEAGCSEASSAKISWTQVEGLPLASLDARSFEVHARTLPRSTYLTGPWPPGVVAVSPRTQGRYVLEGSAQVQGRAPERLRVTITSIARATGMSSLAVSQRVMLGGEGWRIVRGPGHAQLQLHDGITHFTADAPGRYFLAQGANQLELQALMHDHTPMDCGRAECHASISRAAESTPMSHAFELPFAHGVAQAAATCMLECHVVGEPGLSDGGFRDLARQLGERNIPATSYVQLPHALQRLAGVRCTSCHGPGAIPAQVGRARILRASVCATCHDSPPAYQHVAEWQSSRMARSDHDPASRQTLRCARCHTTGGFLHSQGVRVRDDWSLEADGEPVGIACAACHTPHGPAVGHGLVRTVETHGGARGEPCLACHAPLADELVPSASSAVLVQGRVQLPAALGGELISGPKAHEGCVSCHGKREGAPLDHSFRVDPKLPRADEGPVHERAGSVLRKLDPNCPSAHIGEPVPCSPSLSRARYLARLVFDDRGAAAHNAQFANQLLDEAERY